MGQIWQQATIGASGGVYGLLIAFGILNGDRQVYIFPFPIAIKARYIVAIWIFIAFVSAFGGANGIAEFAHLGGAFFGWLYLRFIPRYGLQVAASEGMFGIRNRYYKWKRRQAAKKFEVYMRSSKREDYFDEHGNYRGPSVDKKDDDSKLDQLKRFCVRSARTRSTGDFRCFSRLHARARPGCAKFCSSERRYPRPFSVRPSRVEKTGSSSSWMVVMVASSGNFIQ